MLRDKIREFAGRVLGDRLGWKTDRKLMVIESDDWGSLYLPDTQRTARLIEAKLLTEDAVEYHRYDCLETADDISQLCDVLSQFQDCRNRRPRFTFNTVMGNPDFEKIRQANFQSYFHQSLFQSYIEYHDQDVKPTWMSAVEQGFIVPQFHAREHLNVPLWMRDLQNNREDTRFAFDNHYFAQRRSNVSPISYLTAYWPETRQDLSEIERITLDGLRQFEQEFGFQSKTFVACAYVLPREIEKCTALSGVQLIQTGRRHRMPIPVDGSSRFPNRVSGWKNEFGQVYSIRNVIFEPSLELSNDWLTLALDQVATAFFHRKPAIVCSHRLNYVSGKHKRRQEENLKLLKKFLSALIDQYPDIEFVSSDELIELMS